MGSFSFKFCKRVCAFVSLFTDWIEHALTNVSNLQKVDRHLDSPTSHSLHAPSRPTETILRPLSTISKSLIPPEWPTKVIGFDPFSADHTILIKFKWYWKDK